MSNITDIITTGLNNPECSIWVGMAVGQWITYKYLLFFVSAYIILKIVDTLAFEPLLQWLKVKLWSRKQKNDSKK